MNFWRKNYNKKEQRAISVLAGIVVATALLQLLYPANVSAARERGWFEILVLPSKSAGISILPTHTEREPAKEIWVMATAYSSTVDQTDDTPCITANGYDVCAHYEEFGMGDTIAANFLPLEGTVRLPDIFGNKEFVVRDRMNRRYGYGRIDIWLPTRAEAIQFGAQWIRMEIY